MDLVYRSTADGQSRRMWQTRSYLPMAIAAFVAFLARAKTRQLDINRSSCAELHQMADGTGGLRNAQFEDAKRIDVEREIISRIERRGAT